MDKESGGGPAIGDLRWRVTIANRVQVPSSDPDAGITETFERLQVVHANVEPIGKQTWWGSIQVDRPITHMITMRWLDGLDNTQAILLDTTRKDGSLRTQVFRIRRIAELGGRKRWIVVDVEEEQVSS